MLRESPTLAIGLALAAMSAAVPVAQAEGGNADLVAQARALEHGEGVRKDPAKAIELYCRAARDGDAEAQYALGWMYANGRGVPRDDALAAGLFRLAAGNGNDAARRALEHVRADGDSLPACMEAPAPVQDPDAALREVEALLYGIPDADAFTDLATWKRPVAQLVAELAPAYSVHPRLAIAIIAVESNFDPRARSPKDAGGLMQLMPATAARFGVRDRYRISDNVRGGIAYLQWLLSYYRGDVTLAVAAYNAGEEAVDRYGGIPPYPETRAYVQRVRKLFTRERHPYDPGIATASPVVGRAASSVSRR